MDLFLKRDVADSTHTYGVLTFDVNTFQTIELPWKDNQHGISCVPVGFYNLVTHDSEAHPKTWALVNPALNVIHFPDPAYPTARVACLIHNANWAFQLQGCVGVGLSRGVLNGIPAVLSSVVALNQIKAALPWVDGHTLTIS